MGASDVHPRPRRPAKKLEKKREREREREREMTRQLGTSRRQPFLRPNDRDKEHGVADWTTSLAPTHVRPFLILFLLFSSLIRLPSGQFFFF